MNEPHDRTARPVVVGTDGTATGVRAVRYATEQARERGTGLRIVHVTPGYIPAGPSLPVMPDNSLRGYGLRVLREAGDQVHKEAPDLFVETALVTAGRVAGLVANSGDAQLLVLGNGHRPLSERIWTGNTVTGVITRVRCPVVVVPREWSPGQTRGSVVVGYKGARHAAEMVLAAAAVADAVAGEVVVLHAWQLPPGYDDIIVGRTEEERWAAAQTRQIETCLHRARAAHPDVPIRIEVVHEQAAHALVRASVTADRILLMRPDHGRLFHHLGSVARAVVREAHCPVELLLPLPAGRTAVEESATEQASEAAR